MTDIYVFDSILRAQRAIYKAKISSLEEVREMNELIKPIEPKRRLFARPDAVEKLLDISLAVVIGLSFSAILWWWM